MYRTFCQQLDSLIAISGSAEFPPHLFIAYSGGLDSTVLLHLSARYAQAQGIAISAVHIHHGLSDCADDWQQHCQAQCQILGVDFKAIAVSVKCQGKGLEAQAREARYDALALYMEQSCQYKRPLLLTGQHQDDQVETFLLQLKRGAGSKGLAAMPAIKTFYPQLLSDGFLLRPLLSVTQKQLQQYAVAKQMVWVDDKSNQDIRIDRNFLRHQVIPMLNQRFAGFDKAVCRSIAHIAAQQQLVEQLAAVDWQSCQSVGLDTQTHGLQVPALLELNPLRRNNVLRYWLEQQGATMPSERILQRIVDEVLGARFDAAPLVCWQHYQVRRFKGQLFLTHQGCDQSGVNCQLNPWLGAHQLLAQDNQVLGCLTFEVECEVESEVESEVECKKTAPGLRPPNADEQVSIRYAPKGQFNRITCQRYGYSHRQKLGELFKHYQIPPWRRTRTPLVYYNEQLVAVAGLFVCHNAAAFDATDTLKLSFTAQK